MKVIHGIKALRNFILSLPLTALVLAGCGGDSDDPPPVTLSGVVVDGYITGATVFLDLNGDRVFNEGEPFTSSDENGAYQINVSGAPSSFAELEMIAFGGQDADSGLPFEGQFKLRIESQNQNQILSPFNTLANALVEKGFATNTAQAQMLIAEKFAIDPSDVAADPIPLKNAKPHIYAHQFALQQTFELMTAANPDANASIQGNRHRMVLAFAESLRNQSRNAGLGECIRAMNLNQANVAAQFAERLRDSIQVTLQDEDQIRQRETLRTLLQTMTQLRSQLIDCESCQLTNEAVRLEQRLQLQVGAVSGLVDDDPTNDAAALQKIRTRNQQASN